MRAFLLSGFSLIFIFGVANAVPTTERKNNFQVAFAVLGKQTPNALSDPQKHITSLLFADNDRLLIGNAGGIRSAKTAEKKIIDEFEFSEPVKEMARAKNRLIVRAAQVIYLIDLTESLKTAKTRKIPLSVETASCIAISSDGNRFAYLSEAKTISIREWDSQREIAKIENRSPVLSLSFTAKGRILASASRMGWIRIDSISANGDVVQLLSRKIVTSPNIQVRFSDDGRHLGVSSAGRIHIYDAVTGTVFRYFIRRFDEGVYSAIEFAPNSNLIAAVTEGSQPVVRVWNYVRDQEIAEFYGHLGDLNALAFSPDASLLAVGGRDECVSVWKIKPVGRPIAKLDPNRLWSRLDTLDAMEADSLMNWLIANPMDASIILDMGVKNLAKEQKEIESWFNQLDHRDYRVREKGQRELLNLGLRSAAFLTDSKRPRLSAEGESRIEQILEHFQKNQGLSIPDSGLFANPLRFMRAMRVLELIATPEARKTIEYIAKECPEGEVGKEARSILSMWAEDKK